MGCFYVIGIRVSHRNANAPKLQEVLTKNGCQIKLRVGLHDAGEGYCSDDGVILLQTCGEKEQMEELVAQFNALDGIQAKCMDLN